MFREPEPPTKPPSQDLETAEQSDTVSAAESSAAEQVSVATSQKSSQREAPPPQPEDPVPLYDRNLIRMLAETNFINGEVRGVMSQTAFSLQILL